MKFPGNVGDEGVLPRRKRGCDSHMSMDNVSRITTIVKMAHTHFSYPVWSRNNGVCLYLYFLTFNILYDDISDPIMFMYLS